jgi:dethiobiotin synthetase
MKRKKEKKSTKVVFVTATNTDVGKSYACKKLLEKYAKKGLKVGYFKPIETGVITQPQDGSKLLQLAQKLNKDFKVSIHDVVPYQFKLPAAPYVAKKDTKISIKTIIKKSEYLKQFCDILIIEGAGGLMVPIKKNYFIIDLIQDLNAKAILITPSKLGCINDTLLSMQALQNQKIKFKWYINLYLDKDSFSEVTLPFYQSYFKKISYI